MSNSARRWPRASTRWRANDEVEAIVLTGTGTMFSAGVDLKRLSAGGVPDVRTFPRRCTVSTEEVFFHPKPVVAVINGHAVAGGAILACCADRRIMAHEVGRIGVTEMLVGVPFPALAFEVLRAAVRGAARPAHWPSSPSA